MKRIPKLLLVTFLNLSFVALLAVFVRRTLAPSHFAALLAYVPRPLFLAFTVALFYTGSLAKVTSFLGLRKNILRPWLIGMVLTIPNALLLFLLMSWKKIPLAFDPTIGSFVSTCSYYRRIPPLGIFDLEIKRQYLGLRGLSYRR
ncbi:MAG: hypothetical protein WBC70_18650 [Candidatus Aminicenantales bacterium]